MFGITDDYTKYLLLQNASYTLIEKVITQAGKPINYQTVKECWSQVGQNMEVFKLMMSAITSLTKPLFLCKPPFPSPCYDLYLVINSHMSDHRNRFQLHH